MTNAHTFKLTIQQHTYKQTTRTQIMHTIIHKLPNSNNHNNNNDDDDDDDNDNDNSSSNNNNDNNNNNEGEAPPGRQINHRAQVTRLQARACKHDHTHIEIVLCCAQYYYISRHVTIYIYIYI